MGARYYPGYMASVVDDLERLGIDVMMSDIDTGNGVEANAQVIRSEILKLTSRSTGRNRSHRTCSEDSTTDHESTKTACMTKVCLYGHSKGAVDALAALSLYPELESRVAAFVSAQGPHGASWVAEDLSQTT